MSILSTRTFALVAASGALLVACAKVPFTGRLQYNLVPAPLMRSIGASTYATMLSEAKIQRKGEDVDVLERVGRKISKAADEPKYDWEYKLLQDDAVNAWALPGGKIAFYTGILPALRNEAGMAFVMGHEVGHATAHHGAERLSQQLTLIGGLGGLELYLSDQTKLTPRQRAVILASLGVGITVGVLLPYSRMHESEADVIGVMYMSKAGYPPEESLKVWNRMGKVGGPVEVPPFLSTHPRHEDRQENIREWLPRAEKRYERNALARDTLELRWPMNGGAAVEPEPEPETEPPPQGRTRPE